MINCPLAFGVCDNICRNYSEQGCGYFFPLRPWNDILTLEERLERLEHKPRTVIYPANYSQLQGRLVHLESKITEMRATKKKRTYKQYI